MRAPQDETTEAYEKATAKAASPQYVLRLYIAGITPKSRRALENIKAVCEQHLKNRYALEVVDIYRQPVLAQGEQIVAVADPGQEASSAPPTAGGRPLRHRTGTRGA